MPTSRAASRPAADWARRNDVPGARHVRCLAAPPDRKSCRENADRALALRYGDAKKTKKSRGVSGEKNAGQTGGRGGAVASGRRRWAGRKAGQRTGRRPENNANAESRRGSEGRAAPATRRKRGTRARGSGGERGERAPLRQAECRFHDVFTMFSGCGVCSNGQLTMLGVM